MGVSAKNPEGQEETYFSSPPEQQAVARSRGVQEAVPSGCV